MKVYKKNFIKHKNKIISSIFLLAIIVLLTTQVFAYPTTYSIGVDDVLQEQTYWCWAASSVSILSYFGESVTQGSFVTAVTGISPPPNVGASDSQVKSGLAMWGVASILTTSYLPYNTIILEIYNYERPIYAGWSLTQQQAGHTVVIDGYDINIDNYVEYMNPGYGDHFQCTYTLFKGGTGYDHVWNGTLYQMQL